MPAILPVVLLLYLLMLPVTAMVPVLRELTAGRYPELGEFELHLFMSANMLGALLFVPLAGLLSDLWQRRKALIVLAMGVNALSVWMLLGDWPWAVYLLWRFIEGCAHITALSLLMTMAGDHLHARGGRGLGGGMGLVGAAISLGVATGAPLGGWIGQHGADEVLRYGAGLLALLFVLSLLWLRESPAPPRRTGLGGLLRALPQNRALLLPYAFAFVDRLTVGVIVSTLSLYLSSVIGMSALAIGLVMAMFLLPFSLLTWPAGLLSQRWNPVKMMFLGSLAYGLTLAGVGFVSAGWIPWLMFLGGVVAALMYAPSLLLVAALSQPAHKAISMGGFNFFGSLGFVLGPLLGGALVTLYGQSALPPYPMALATVAVLELVCVLLFLPWAIRRRWSA